MRLSARQLAAELRSAFSHLRTSEGARGIGLSILIGVCAGLSAVAFWKALNGLHTLFFTDGGRALGFLGSYYVIILPAIGGLIVGLIIHFWAKDAKGEGVPEAMAEKEQPP